ncbi:GAP family protein [Gordonia spumicola]|nr:GAP family protein [Gordonia spumicola]
MGAMIVDVLPAAVGVATSPVLLIAVVLVLLSERARPASIAFAAGSVGTIATITGAAAVLGGAADPDASSPMFMYWVKLLGGAVLVVFGIRRWRGRHESTEQPAWMASLAHTTPAKALLAGIVVTAANPKHLVFFVAAGVGIGAAGLGAARESLGVAVFVLLAGSSMLLLVFGCLIAPAWAAPRLVAVRTWLEHHTAALIAVILIVLGVILVGQGLGGLVSR